MTKISVIIPSRNEIQNLVWTLQAAQAEFHGHYDYELIPVLNLPTEEDVERITRYDNPRGLGEKLKILIYDVSPSCWQARNYGASMADGDYLLFLDSHVYPRDNAFRRLVEFHEGWKGVAHCPLNYWLDPDRTNYGYVWQPQKFWGRWTRQKPSDSKGSVPLSGTSSSLIDRDVFEEIKGIHPALGIYGGGEPYIDLKVQMFGYDVRVAVDCELFHLTETRGYSWNKHDLRRNFMIAAYAIGGKKYYDRVYQHYWDDCRGVKKWEDAFQESADEAIEFAEEDRQFIANHAKFTLDEVVTMWPDERKEKIE